MRYRVYWAVMSGLLLVFQTGYGANDGPHNVLPIPQLKNAPSRQEKPDLVVRSLSVRERGRCEPGRTVITFEVVVANMGKAPALVTTGSPMVVRVIDKHNNGWGGKTELKEQIPPGGSVTVAVQVAFFQSDPAHMAARVLHPFTAFVAPAGQMEGAHKDNNAPPPVNVSLWEYCSGRNP